MPVDLHSAVCPSCGGYVVLQAADRNENDAACALQTFAVLKKVLTTATTAPMTEKPETNGGPLAAAKLRRAVSTLEAVVEDWCQSPALGLHDDALHTVRPGLTADLQALLQFLEPFYPQLDLTRRAAALLKQFLTFMDRRCGVSETTYFSPKEICPECLGSHPRELCFFHPKQWVCEMCGEVGVNKGLGRYLCTQCLALRPCVRELFPAECWECTRCRRANMEFERYCMHCGHGRPREANPTLADTRNGVEAKEKDISGDANESGSTATGVCQRIPFCPIRCTRCGEVYIDLRCLQCCGHLSGVLMNTIIVEIKRHERHPRRPEIVVAHRPPDCLRAHEDPMRSVLFYEGRSTQEVVNQGDIEPTCMP
ncbi:unnamed protein product [Phytomonas sp. Hart1]|nr:unnamed protein product [Phytomonas sp. Hart1]|eukprot:CCW69843.1 unnamed protein product [Phytomonas sp. isolate Hart1]